PLKGRVFFQPAGCLWCPAGNSDGEQGWNYAASFDPATNQWTQHGMPQFGVRNAPVTALLALRPPTYAAQILTATGTLNRAEVAVPFTEFTDLSKSPPTHVVGPQMAFSRWFANHVLLPDGTLVVVGGAKNDGVTVLGGDANPVSPVKETEMYVPGQDPTKGAWQTLAPMSIDRIYHSTALLLPDATVWVAGSVPAVLYSPASPPRQDAVEIFEPPYLFRGPRPVIEQAPAQVTWDETFNVRTPDAKTVTAVMVRTGAVTHVYNPEQRVIELVVENRTPGVITLRAPPDAALAPPGHYMLFLLKPTEKGPVPSVAPILKLA
ncbi:MAG TPA: galactose oxidase-like domain-containing protein, partial [Candidatus Thermoplasmatota archaeon]|nr:galactose oxidase-like domain-containing protein [Candidatus Thermoplasmatota archaeon]